MAKVYLCGAINQCSDEEAFGWRELASQSLPNAVNPMVRDYRGSESKDYREIVELDKRDIRRSDVVLVRYTRPSVGTSMEILYAWQLGKPVVLWCDKGANLSPWLIYHSTAIVCSLADAIDRAARWAEPC